MSVQITTFLLAFLLAIPASLFAEKSDKSEGARGGAYSPSNQESSTPDSSSASSRAECPLEEKTISFTLLKPKSSAVPLSFRSAPTFWFSLSERPSQPVVFSLVNPRARETIIIRELNSVKKGLNQVEFPELNLEPGKEYRWSITLICDRNRRDLDIYKDALLKIAKISTQLENQLNKNNDCDLFAKYKLNYDEMTCLLLSSSRL